MTETDPAPPNVRVGMYLRADQVALLDQLRNDHRAAGRRTVSQSDIVRAALDLAAQAPAKWDKAIAKEAR